MITKPDWHKPKTKPDLHQISLNCIEKLAECQDNLTRVHNDLVQAKMFKNLLNNLMLSNETYYLHLTTTFIATWRIHFIYLFDTL